MTTHSSVFIIANDMARIIQKLHVLPWFESFHGGSRDPGDDQADYLIKAPAFKVIGH
jgi:hypothetical protein